MSSELYPCPFCGSQEWEGDSRALSLVSDNSSYVIYCRCGASGPVKDTKEEAIAHWNGREGCEQQPLWNSSRVPSNDSAVDFKGNLRSMGIATLLQILSRENRSGILQFNRDQLKSAIYFRNGHLVAASGNQLPRLGEMILSAGLIPAERLEDAVKTAKRSGKRLGEVLLDLGYIGHNTLRELVRRQIREAVLDLFLWREGEFEYQDCDFEIDKRGIGETNIMELILEGVRRLKESEERPEELALAS
jgi:Lar family restriction alleviation protein